MFNKHPKYSKTLKSIISCLTIISLNLWTVRLSQGQTLPIEQGPGEGGGGGCSSLLDINKDVVQQPDGTLLYTLTYENTSTSVAVNPYIQDDLPAYLNYLTGSSIPAEPEVLPGDILKWSLADLEPGAGGTISFRAQISGLLDDYEDTCGISNRASFHAQGMIAGLSELSVVTQSCEDLPDASDLVISVAPNPVQAGENVAFEIDWSLFGNGSVNNAVVTSSALPDELTFISAPGGAYNPADKKVTWPLETISNWQTGDVELVAGTASPLPDGTAVSLSASLSADGLAQQDDDTQATIESDFQVGLTKTAPSQISPGEKFSYTLDWQVSGNSPVDALTLTDTLPANTAFVEASDSGAEAGNVITWDLGSHNPGDQGTVTLTVRANWPLTDGTAIINDAEICGTATGAGEDCDQAQATTTVNSGATLTVTASDNPDPVQAGENVIYTLEWSVGGSSPTTNLLLTTILPTETTFVSSDNGGVYEEASRIVTWSLGDQDPNSSGSVNLTLATKPTLMDGTSLNATALLESDESEPVSDSEQTRVTNVPILELTKTADQDKVQPGDEVNYTITVENTGYAIVQNLVLTDVLPGKLYFSDVLGNSRTLVSGGDLAVGDSITLTYPVKVGSEATKGSYANTATLTADNHSTLTAEAVISVEPKIGEVKGEEAFPNLVLSKTVESSFANPGDLLTYTVKVTNDGEAPAENVAVTDTLPAGFSFVETGGTTRTWEIELLTVNESKTFTYTVTVGALNQAGLYDNNVKATASNADEVTAKARVEIRTIEVKGEETGPDDLADTGAGPFDSLLLQFAFITLAGVVLSFVTQNRRHQKRA